MSMERNEDDRLLFARLEDASKLTERHYTPQFLGFLDERQAYLCREYLKHRTENAVFWGGYEDAQRVYLGIFPYEAEETVLREAFPLTPITFSFRKDDSLGHRDFLGALMALGIRRDTLGDILIEQGRGVVFAQNEIADYIVGQCRKIGNVGVKASVGAYFPYPAEGKRENMRVTVASERLDCVISAVTHCSRGQSLEWIHEELVTVNYEIAHSASQEMRQGDVFSVRGRGKFRIAELDGVTKKGRLVLQIEKYI